MYKGCVYSYDRIETWKEVAKNSNIQPFVFMKFALIYWLNKKRDVSLELELKQFTQLLNAICSIASKFGEYISLISLNSCYHKINLISIPI